MKIKEPFSYKIFIVFTYVLLTCFALICFYPFWYVVCYSLSDGLKVISNTGFLVWPEGFTLKAYVNVFENQYIWHGFKNSIIVLLVGIPFGLVLTTFGAYFMAQKDLYFKKYIMWYIILTMYISGGTIPLYLTMKMFGLTGNLGCAIVPGALSFFNMVIMRTAFEGVPDSLAESARIDGAGHLVIMKDILVPLTKGTFAVITMYRALALWNTWYWPSMTIRDKKKLPLQSVLRTIYEFGAAVDEVETSKTTEYATLIVAIIPVLLAYPMMQKHFTKGVLIGSVKG